MSIKMNNRKEFTLKEAFDKFKKDKKMKGLSEETIIFYKNCFKKFMNFYDGNNKIKEINKEIIEEYTIQLKENLKNVSVNTYLRGLKSFLYYCMDKNMLDNFKISLIKVTKKKKEGYTKSQLKKLLKKPDMKYFGEYRNWVIINMLLATGCRVRTLLNIKIKDVDIEEGYVKFRKTKQKREQILPLPQTMQNILIEYLNIRDGEKDNYLFCSIYGGKLTRSGLTNAIRKYNNKRGVEDTSIHKFRHTFSKMFIKNGGTIHELKQILGHKNIKTTENYINLLIEDYKEDINAKNPLESLNKSNNKILMD